MRFLFCALGAFVLAACGEAAAVDDEVDTATSADASSDDENAQTEDDGPAILDAIPAKYRGTWDVRQNNPTFCTDLSDGIMRVEAKEILFYEAVFTAESIEETSSSAIRAVGAFQELGENSDEIYTLTVRDGGKRLTLAGEGFEPFAYDKCDKVREAHVIPAQFQGTWSSQGTCDVDDRDKLLVVEATRQSWFGKTSNYTRVEMVGDGAVELEHDGQDDPFGLVLQPGGKSGSLVGPGHSPIPLIKCSN